MLYTGIDIVEVARIEQAVRRWGYRFLARVFTPAECIACGFENIAHGRFTSLAARWAAKEATAKLLGMGLSGLAAETRSTARIAWLDVEVGASSNGRPLLLLHGAAATRAQALGLVVFDLSLSHTTHYAVASAVGLTSFVLKSLPETRGSVA